MTVPDTAPTIPSHIETDRLTLRPPRESGAEAIIEAIAESRAELGPWMAWAPSMRESGHAREFIRRTQGNWAAGEDFGFSIVRREDGRLLGGTGLHAPNWAVPSLEIGYWMRTSEVGKGYVREAVTALTRVGFGQLGLRRMAITCAATNARSRRVAEAVGYRLEACLRNEDRLPDGSLRDTLVYSLIDTDEVVERLLGSD